VELNTKATTTIQIKEHNSFLFLNFFFSPCFGEAIPFLYINRENPLFSVHYLWSILPTLTGKIFMGSHCCLRGKVSTKRGTNRLL